MRDARPLMIFAAGFGTRMGALTAHRPKPMLELAGRRMIDRAIDIGLDAGCAPIVVNTHYRADIIRPVLEERGVAISHEDPKILDTGGGLKHALPRLGDGIVATLNPDAAWLGPNPLAALEDAPWPDDAGALLLIVPRARVHARTAPGDFDRATDGRLTRGDGYVYTGAQLIRSDAVARIPAKAFSLNSVWNALAAEGSLYGQVYEGEVCDVGHPDGLALADRLIRDHA